MPATTPATTPVTTPLPYPTVPPVVTPGTTPPPPPVEPPLTMLFVLPRPLGAGMTLDGGTVVLIFFVVVFVLVCW